MAFKIGSIQEISFISGQNRNLCYENYTNLIQQKTMAGSAWRVEILLGLSSADHVVLCGEKNMKIGHVAIWSKDIESLKAFYEKYFNAQSNDKYMNPTKGFSSYFLSFNSGAQLEIMQKDSVPETTNDPYEQFTGLIHLAFSIGTEEQVDSLTAQLKKDGFEVLDGPRRTGDGYYESAILDLDKNRIEITT